jgi:hypothetical protein
MSKSIIFLSLLLSSVFSFSQNFQWATKGGKNSIGNDMVLDLAENVYTAGSIIGNSSTSAILIEKHNTIGNLVWQHIIDGTSQEGASSIAIDNNSNIFVTGFFYGTVDFNPSAAVNNLIAVGSVENIFIAKYDSAGNFIWAKNMGGTTGNGRGLSICIDKSNKINITGYFSGTVDFDTGSNTYNLTGSNQDVFITKLDNNGNFIWAKKIGGSGIDQGNDIRVDNNGNVLTTGGYRGTVDFDPNIGVYNLTSVSSTQKDIFISKLDSSGNFIWAKSMGGTKDDMGKSLEVDNNGSIYTTGYFIGVSDFDPSTNNYYLGSSSAGTDKNTYISKLDSSGNFVWAKGLNSGFDEEGKKIRIDNNGILYLIGNYKGTTTFPTSPSTTFSYKGGTDMFLCKMSNINGSFLWAKNFGGTDNDDFNSVAVNSNGSSIYTTGSFRKTVDFDPSGLIFNLTTADTSSYDKFILKFGLPCFYVSLSANGSANFCQGASVILSTNINSISGINYQWQNSGNIISTGSLSTLTAVASGGYKVIVNYPGVCTATSNIVYVTVNPLPNVTFSSIQSPVCVNNSTIQLTGSPSGGNYSGIGVNGNSFDPAIAGVGNFTVAYNYTDINNCSNSASQTVSVSLCTGIDEVANTFVSIYPNPANDELSINLDEALNNSTIELYDSMGKLIINEKITAENTKLKIGYLPNGIYSVRVFSNGKQFVKRIIKE